VTTCHFCGIEIAANDHTAYRRVVGWERKATTQSRRSGSDIVLREATGEIACENCIRRLKLGLNVTQEGLFE
jgi:hypothetical protein